MTKVIFGYPVVPHEYELKETECRFYPFFTKEYKAYALNRKQMARLLARLTGANYRAMYKKVGFADALLFGKAVVEKEGLIYEQEKKVFYFLFKH